MIESLASVGSQIISFLTSLIPQLSKYATGRSAINREHDVTVFKKLDTIASESRIDDILNGRIPNSRFVMEDHYALSGFIDAQRRIENSFLDSTLKSRSDELSRTLESLLVFTMKTFSKIHSGFLKFYPDIIDQARYDAEWKELNQKIDVAWNAYRDFRLAVKQRLKV